MRRTKKKGAISVIRDLMGRPRPRDLTIVILLSLTFFAVAIWDLGWTDVPVTTCQISGTKGFYIDLGRPEDVSQVYILVKKADPEVSVSVYQGSPGRWAGEKTSPLLGYYYWKEIGIHSETQYLRFVLRDCQIAEIVVIGEDGRKIPVSQIVGEGGGETLGNMIDEQGKVEYPPTYLSQTYFDEIYYVRNAEEYLNLQEPSERTHPPFGSFLIAAGILTFGYSPFGWRIMGVIFATLMIPVMYVFGKKVFGTGVAAFAASFLWMFGFMNFTMGRMATVDTFAVFFSMLSNLFFFVYFQDMIQRGRASNRKLFLAVLFFALGFSVKWYVAFGFIGQVFFLLILGLESAPSRGGWVRKIRSFLRYPVLPLACFLAVAVGIYLLIYVPFMAIGHSLGDVYQRQWDMYAFHSSLTAEHPFSSQWWSWPLVLRPVWLYASYLPGETVSTIASMGNPSVWWIGLALMIVVIAKAVKEKKFVFSFMAAIFLCQWLPYVVITRCVFLYHFYASVPFLVLAIAYFMNELWERRLGKPITVVYLGVVVAFFVLFYPVISGVPVSRGWIEGLKWLGSWTF
jgi:dolichyl-phosphate-mannose--protein O-mannosyl transferase